ncbi:MAG TPA: GtrA family protein [Terriglobales bacterium]|nr:GtrA family protein [Terriglobales bacterium]
MKRWLKFNAVGFGGIVVQMIVLLLLKSVLKLNYLAGTALAVEAAILNNFFWHERFTWRDRTKANSVSRFVKFNLTTGAISILGNLAIMSVLVGRYHANYLIGNGISIAACSIANFLASDRFVFEKKSPGAVRPRSHLA